MRGCLDEGRLQSYFDGELSREQMESATSHLAACPICAAAARQLESEISLLATALAPELEAVVPTERLRQRIDAAVAGLPPVNRWSSVKTSFGWLTSLFAFTPPRALAYASLAVVVTFGVVFGIIQNRQSVSQAPIARSENPNSPPVRTPVNHVEVAGKEVTEAPSPVAGSKAPLTPTVRLPKTRLPRDSQAVAQVKLIPGERSYLKTIAALDSTIKASNERPMRPALRAEYERNLAVVNRALAATRNAAKKNPDDPDAKEFLFDAYQSKVDLLNTVADARTFNRP